MSILIYFKFKSVATSKIDYYKPRDILVCRTLQKFQLKLLKSLFFWKAIEIILLCMYKYATNCILLWSILSNKPITSFAFTYVSEAFYSFIFECVTVTSSVSSTTPSFSIIILLFYIRFHFIFTLYLLCGRVNISTSFLYFKYFS